MPYEQFDLKGWAERVEIRIERDGFREPRARNHYAISLADGEIAYRRFPLHVRNLHGTVTSRELAADASGRSARVIEFDGLRGEAADGGVVLGSGMVLQPADGAEKIEIKVVGQGLVSGRTWARPSRRPHPPRAGSGNSGSGCVPTARWMRRYS
ncbi:MAG: hypothetical protein HC813_01460 [Planctomycetes bacterium]|nr:hypothetical protein [Planctomycetota bacterium]